MCSINVVSPEDMKNRNDNMQITFEVSPQEIGSVVHTTVVVRFLFPGLLLDAFSRTVCLFVGPSLPRF